MKQTPLRALLVIALICIETLSISGCASKNKKKDAPGGIPLSNQITFSDLPVPKGFQLLRDQSYAYKDGQARIALLRYKGKGKIDDVSWFYQQNMADFQWKDINIIDYDKNIQQFVKGDESALVTIEKVNDPWFFIIPYHKILITIQLLPKQQLDADAGAPIVPQAYSEPDRYEAPSRSMSLPVLK
ncbi:MAG: hypothetical protein RBU23_12260 [Candidatus Auribacterota bacterium]|nr:hypothetical protein [Candidatus Auribacterota bacterium]